MFFNESKRKSLLAKYEEAEAVERALLRVLAAIFVPVPIAVLSKVWNGIMSPSIPNGPSTSAPENISFLIDRMDKLGLVIHGAFADAPSTELYLCHRLLAEPLSRESARTGEFRQIHNAILRTPEVLKDRNIHNIRGYFTHREGYMRDLRAALYTQHEKTFQELCYIRRFEPNEPMDFLVYSLGETPKFKDPLMEIVCNPLDADLLLNLPSYMRLVCFERLNDLASLYPELHTELARLLPLLLKKENNRPYITLSLATIHLERGDFKAAEQVLETPLMQEFPESWALRATLALVHGNASIDLRLFDQGIKLLCRYLRKRKSVSYESWFSFLHPLLIMSLDPSDTGRKRMRDIVAAALETSHEDFARSIFNMLDYFTHPFGQREDIFDLDEVTDITAASTAPAVILCYFLLGSWADPDRLRTQVPMGIEACLRMRSLGMLAQELASILRILDPDCAGKLEAIPEPKHPLRLLLQHKPAWKTSLEDLVQLASEKETTKGKSGDKRIIWRLEWSSPKDGRQREITNLKVKPCRQTMGKSGWSIGQSVALDKFIKNPDSEEAATEQDKRIIRSPHLDNRYYIWWEFQPNVVELANHPLLFRGETNERVEVAIGEPMISVLESGDNYIIAMDPYPSELHEKSAVIIREESHNSLRIYELNDSHMRLARILGRKGLKVPATEKEGLLRALGGLASFVTVHSAVAGVASGTEKVEPDARLFVLLQPLGKDGLDAEVVVRPLGSGSAVCAPGVGGENIFGMQDGRRVTTRRDLAAERQSLADMATRCPALGTAEQFEDADNRWAIDTPELALELLLQLQDLEPERAVVEWPKGGERRISRILPSNLTMRVQSGQDWFSVSGKVQVDDGLVLTMQQLVKHASGAGKFIPLGGNSFLALTEAFRRRIETIAALGDVRADDIRLPALSIALLRGIEEDVGAFQECTEWRTVAAKFDEAETLTPAVPSTFTGELREYQAEGFTWMMRRAHCGCGVCLADDMGLGKTIQALAVLLARGAAGPALVIAPTSVCANWMDEAARFAGSLNFHELRTGDRESTVNALGPMDVLVSSYGLLVSEQELLTKVDWHTILLDEAQAIKNMDTKRSAAAMELKSDFRIATTGTPIENNLSELWNIFRYNNPGYLGSLDRFNTRLAVPIEQRGDKNARRRLKRLIAPFVLRRTKSQVLTELPPKTEMIRHVTMNDEERVIYEAVRKNAIEAIDASDSGDKRMIILAQLVKLRRACCNSALVLHEEEARPSAKMDAFVEIVEELRASGHKALVFSQFVGHLTFLRRRLDQLGITYQYLDGSTPPAQRASSVSAFQAGTGDCFLISLKAGGTGLNLTAADYVIHMDPWWNPAVEEQASDRTHRIGQHRPVTVCRIIAKDTVEDKIVKLHGRKKELAESLLDDTGAPSRLSSEDMLRLIKGEDLDEGE
jgi:hypothetical protein